MDTKKPHRVTSEAHVLLMCESGRHGGIIHDSHFGVHPPAYKGTLIDVAQHDLIADLSVPTIKGDEVKVPIAPDKLNTEVFDHPVDLGD